jgi:hypothetical protein
METAELTGQQVNALRDAKQSRETLIRARYQYHLTLVIAYERGLDAEEIARALDTRPLYIANTLRQHREGKCECARRAKGA